MNKPKQYFVMFKDLATNLKDGIMRKEDKIKLDGIAENANNYTHPKSGVKQGGYTKVTVDANGHIVEGSNPTTLAGYGITDAATKEHTHSDATQSASGLLSATDKRKLDGIAENANNITVDATLNKTSANPVQNKAIATELESLKKSGSDGKNSVANAVTAMGVPTATDADFATIAANIKKISTGVDTTDATALAGEILLNKTAYVNEKKVVGTMLNQGAKTAALNCGGSYTIPVGYHNGAGSVTANSLASQTQATLSAAGKLRNGVTAWANGTKYTGNMPEKEAKIYVPNTTDQVINAGQYLAGAQTIKGDANLVASNIKKGVTIFGITGNFSSAENGYMGYRIKNIATPKFTLGHMSTSEDGGHEADYYRGEFTGIHNIHVVLIGKNDFNNYSNFNERIKNACSIFDIHHKFYYTEDFIRAPNSSVHNQHRYAGFIEDELIKRNRAGGIFETLSIDHVDYNKNSIYDYYNVIEWTCYSDTGNGYLEIIPFWGFSEDVYSALLMHAMIIELDI